MTHLKITNRGIAAAAILLAFTGLTRAAPEASQTGGHAKDDVNTGATFNAGIQGNMSDAFGYDDSANGQSASALGKANSAEGYVSTAIGYRNVAAAPGSSAIGHDNDVQGQSASAFGHKNKVNTYGTNASAFGWANLADKNATSAFGFKNVADSSDSSAFGFQNHAWGSNSVAFGYENYAKSSSSVSMGNSNQSQGDDSVAVGFNNIVTGAGSSAVGYENGVSGATASAFGRGNTAAGQYASVFGYSSDAAGNSSTAIGYQVQANTQGSSAFGSGVINGIANSVMIGPSGSATITVVDDGSSSHYPKFSIGAGSSANGAPIYGFDMDCGFFHTSFNTESLPPSTPYGGLIVGFNRSGGNAEVNFYNAYVGGSTPAPATTSFVFSQLQPSGGNVDLMMINGNGTVGIGTISPNSNYKLDVIGTIHANEVLVDTSTADYVFAPDYKLAPLSEVEKAIKRDRHLPGIPSAKDMTANRVNIGDLQIKLLAKVEELTLHQIDQEKQLVAQQKLLVDQQAELQQLKQENAALRSTLH